jgi:GNAT superfamily N-acetyltransferase
MKNFVVKEDTPNVEEYNALRESLGLRTIEENLAKIGLRHTLYAISFYHNKKLVAMGRVVGDMGIIFYLQDVIVHPNYQNMGVGTKIIKKLLGYIEGFAPNGEEIMVGLMSIKGKEAFYEKHGFFRRPQGDYGNGMSLLLNAKTGQKS